MLTKLFSKLSLYGSSEDAGQRAHSQHRFDTDVNLFPELAERSPRIAPDISYFLAIYGVDADEVLKRSIISVPDYDDSLPLADYFVSSSHNTYLLENQLWGKSCASAYTRVITSGAHCIEIDAWPGPNGENQGPIVTHGWTLTQDVCFRDICKAIRSAVEEKEDDWPVFVSLECHVGLEDQKELVEIMKEAWGERLVDAHVEGYERDPGLHITPRQLRGRIVMMIEHYPEGKNQEDYGSDMADDDSEDSLRSNSCAKISDELAGLGIYALSVKPKKDWYKQVLDDINILINISESALSSLLPHALSDLISHGQRHLRRVYPRGTRIMSGNLNPLIAWRAGSHFAALNWQEYDKGMQMNEAMFVGSSGWVSKPAKLRATGVEGQEGLEKLGFAVRIIGLSSLAHPDGKDTFKARVRVVLYHESGKKDWKSRIAKAKASSPGDGADAMFNDTCSWVIDADELAFIRILVTADDDKLALFCARLSHIQQGYRFIRLLDMKGKDSGATLLVNFTMSNVS